jgi:hypothetical protein
MSRAALEAFPRIPLTPLTFGRSLLQRLDRLSAHLGGGVEIWAKREDVNSGLAFGGNKTRKLEYLAADALAQGCDTLVSIGGVQSPITLARWPRWPHTWDSRAYWSKSTGSTGTSPTTRPPAISCSPHSKVGW